MMHHLSSSLLPKQHWPSCCFLVFPVSHVCDVKCDTQKTEDERLTCLLAMGDNRNLFSGFPPFKKTLHVLYMLM